MYTITVRDIAQRRQEIEQKKQAPLGFRAFYEHRPEGEQLPLISLDIATPVYRMANYRTQTSQLSYRHQNGLPETFFRVGEEDTQAQRAQHGLLVTLAKEGSGGSIKPILDALRSDQRQTEPLLVTTSGVVVNGNRRLAAMRELFAEDSTQFQCFQQIQAMVLPEVTANDLRRIEVRLQMRPETRLPYDWTNAALAVRDLQGCGVSKGEIVSLMRLEKEADVDAIIERLTEAEIYLTSFLGDSDEYAAVSDQEQQFIELQKALRTKNGAQEKELARKMCHVITKHSRALGTRAYEYKIAYGPQTSEVATRLAARLNIAIQPVAAPPVEENAADLFGDIAVEGINGLDFSPLETVLSDGEKSAENVQQIKEVCDELRDEATEQNRGKRASKSIGRALSALMTVEFDTADPDTYGAIVGDLEAISNRADELLADVTRRQTN